MTDVCFVSVAFQLSADDDRYIVQQHRLKESILAIYPDANLLFFENRLPAKSRTFSESLYGFKPHAIQEAVDNGFKKVVWMDPAMILMDKIDDLLKHWMVAVRDDSKLFRMVSRQACEFFQVTPDMIEALDWHLVGGSLYYFNFMDMRVRSIFDMWKRSEEVGCFGSQAEAASEQINGHRSDETCLALAMYGHRLLPIPPPDVRYCIEKNPMFIKRHFK